MDDRLEIDNIIRVVRELRRNDTPVDDREIERQHAHLMPKLGERLRLLSRFEDLSGHYETSARFGNCVLGELPDDFRQDLEFLRSSLDGYDFTSRIHDGGQGTVYKAVHRATNRLVAVKLLLDGPLASERQRKRFVREIEIVSRLRHPNIVTVYDCGEIRGRLYFTMEYVEGLPIDDYTYAHALGAEAIVRLFTKVCHALSYAHQRGVIHRDLKPSNILVDDGGQPRILDFGMAKDAEADRPSSLITIAGQVCGTLPYLSPEEAAGTDEQPDTRSDIYALGIILYELLTGDFPYPVDVPREEARHNIVVREPRSLRKTISERGTSARLDPSGISNDLEAIVRKTLAKDKERRYQSARDMATDMERYLAGGVVAARKDNRWYVVRKTLRRYRVHLGVAAMLCATLGTAGMFWRQSASRAADVINNERSDFAAWEETLTTIDGSVRTLAGGTRTREALLKLATDKLANLDVRNETRLHRRRLTAATFELRGDLAFDEGHHAEADEHYQAFLKDSQWLADTDKSNDESAVRLTRAHRKMARVVPNWEHHFAIAIGMGETLLADRPNDAVVKAELCKARIDFGRKLYEAGRYESALEQASAARSIAENMIQSGGDDYLWDKLRAKGLSLDGITKIKVGQGGSGIASLERSLRIREQIRLDDPANVENQSDLLGACLYLGTVHRDNDKKDRARALFEEAVVIGEYLKSADPSVATWKRLLYGAHDHLARLLLKIKELEAAQRHCDQAVALTEALILLDSENTDWQRLQGFGYALRGKMWFARDEFERAHEDFQRAFGIREELCTSDPGKPADQRTLAATYDWIGKCCASLDRNAEALTHYRWAYEIREQLLEEQPDVTERALDVILSLTKRATGHLRQDTREDDAEAAVLLKRAEKWLTELREQGKLESNEGNYQEWLREIEKSKNLIRKRAQERGEPGKAHSEARP